MSNHIICIYQLTLSPTNLPAFKMLVREIIDAANNEPGTIEYQYSFDASETSGQIIEKYRSSEDIVSHVDETFAPFGDKFLSLVDITGLTVVGEVSPDAKARLNAFNPIYLSAFAGFAK